jgi:hypothetical protein
MLSSWLLTPPPASAATVVVATSLNTKRRHPLDVNALFKLRTETDRRLCLGYHEHRRQ